MKQSRGIMISIVLVTAISSIWAAMVFPEADPFNALKGDFFTSMVNALVGMYKYTLPSATWTVALIYMYDFFMALSGRSSSYMEEFYKEIRADFIYLIPLTLILFVIYTQTDYSFTNSTIEIGMAGLSFAFYAHVSIVKMFTYRVGHLSFPRKFVVMFCLVCLGSSIYFFSWLVQIANGNYNFSQSLWMQITVLCFSICLYVGNKQIAFFMKKGRMEASPVLLSLIKNLPASNDFYQKAAEASELLNKEMERARAIAAQKQRQQHKGKRKKR